MNFFKSLKTAHIRIQHQSTESTPCWLIVGFVLSLLLVPQLALAASADGPETQARAALLEQLRSDVRGMQHVLGRDHLSPAVEQALATVPRHEFVPPDQRRDAYKDIPLPIGYGQTISQPLIVGIMTELLNLQPGDKVLEIGTGSGYQAAILAMLTDQVYSIEIIPPLHRRSTETLQRLGYTQVHTKLGDGYNGWPDAAPFDAIIVTAAGDHIPPPLIAQLKPGGRMVLPVGSRYSAQQLVLVLKDDAGRVQSRALMPVHFVPLTGGH